MNFKEKIESLADKYNLQLIYSFGSRAKEVCNLVEGKIGQSPVSKSDLDIGVKSEKSLNIQEKVEIAVLFEDLFDVSKADVVKIPEASAFLALEIVKGELLYADDETYEAEYQLYIMRRAADLMPYERMKQKLILGF